MRPPRLTTRRLLALVALVGLTLGIGLLGWRWHTARREAKRYEDMVAIYQAELAGAAQLDPHPWYWDDLCAALPVAIKNAQRFRAAQRRPWLSLPND